MIYDKIENVGRYRGMSKYLDLAIDFLENTELDRLPLGRTEISEDKVFAKVMEAGAKDSDQMNFEIHKKYMDIQIDLEGTEIIEIGLDPEGPLGEFDSKKDFGNVICGASASCVIGKGRFIVCMGEEPHKPGVAAGAERRLKKCVVKVAVE